MIFLAGYCSGRLRIRGFSYAHRTGSIPSIGNARSTLTSYDWNGAVVGYGAVPDCFRSTRFKPDAILLWEGDEFNIPFGGGQWNDFGNYPDEGISARHGKGAIVGLFGGSTERIKVVDWYSTGLAGCGSPQNGFVQDPNFKPDQLPNRVWCNPGATNGMVKMD